MPQAPSVSISIQDSTGRISDLTVYVQSTQSIAEFRGLARAIAATIDNIIDGVIVGASANIPFEGLSVFASLANPLKSVANECDVENKGIIIFESADGRTTTVSIPTISNAVIDDDTNLLDFPGSADLQTFVTAMTSNFVDNALNIVPVNTHDDPLIKVNAGYQRFNRSRKQRSAVRLKT